MKNVVIAAVLFSFCVGFAIVAFAEEDEANPEQPKPVTPIQKILKELKGLVAREKAKPEFDEKLVKDLQKLVKTFDKEAKAPIKLEDLSEADRERLKEEVRKEIEAEAAAAGEERREDWREREAKRRVDAALEGVELTDEQREKVEGMLKDFTEETASAYRGGDVGLVNDLKKDLEKRLKREVGNKKARDIINNVNKQLGRGRGGWGGR
jgi:type I site-specific restriction endonuclease